MSSRRDVPSYLLLLVPLLWLFRRALGGDESFVFRDAAHFYYPLYQYVQSRWANGVPLWNPLDDLGQPLLGDPTAAVLYPGKLVFWLPLSFNVAYALYIVGHLWFAGCGTYRLARAWRVDVQGAVLAGWAYQLSGSVLFQYCNPIYCVGAAWLPWAVWGLNHMLARHTIGSAIGLAVCLCMMVLGGDPQMAYHTLLIGVLMCLLRTKRRRGSWRVNLRMLATATTIALLLSAVQVLPSCEWASLSDRAVSDQPRSLYEWGSAAIAATRASMPWPGLSLRIDSQSEADPDDKTPSDVASNNLASNSLASNSLASNSLASNNGGHTGKIYEFSVGPWRWLELFWPNLSGSKYPIHSRWLDVFPGESRVWSPSLYLGLLPWLLACGQLRVRAWGAAWQIRWLWWIGLLSSLAAMGAFGIGWVWLELRYAVTGQVARPGDLLPGVGGLYWWMTVLLPTYANFRYPAKLWTLTTLAICLLGAIGWRSCWRRTYRRMVQHVSLAVALVSLGLATALVCFRNPLRRWTQSIPPDSLFGPFQSDLAHQHLLTACWHAACVGLVLAMLLQLSGRFPRHRVGWLLLLVTLLDLIIAQTGLVYTAPASNWPAMMAASPGAMERIYRCEAARGYLPTWRQTTSPRRLEQGLRNDIETDLPRYHLLHGARSVYSSVAMRSSAYQAIWDVARKHGHRSTEGYAIPDPQVLRWLGADTWWVPPGDYVELGAEANPTATLIHLSLAATPRTWIAHAWDLHRHPMPTSRKELHARTEDLLYDGSGFRDRVRCVVVEDVVVEDVVEDRLSLVNAAIASSSESDVPTRPHSDESTRIVEDVGDRLRLEVTLTEPGIVVLADQFVPGWRAYVRDVTHGAKGGHSNHASPTSESRVLRVNHVMRGVFLKPGTYEIEYRYWPNSVRLGLLLSGLSWGGLVLWFVLRRTSSWDLA